MQSKILWLQLLKFLRENIIIWYSNFDIQFILTKLYLTRFYTSENHKGPTLRTIYPPNYLIIFFQDLVLRCPPPYSSFFFFFLVMVFNQMLTSDCWFINNILVFSFLYLKQLEQIFKDPIFLDWMNAFRRINDY